MLTNQAVSQVPNTFKYQAVVRDAAGEPLDETQVSVKISIVSSDFFTVYYSEVHYRTTSSFGLIALNIGEGNPVEGDFAGVDWGIADYFVKVEVDPNAGSNFVFMGASQLLSVPYAIYAKHTYGPAVYTWDSLQLLYPQPAEGMMAYLSDLKALAFFNGSAWQVLTQGIPPPVNQAFAGNDTTGVCNPLYLGSNEPDSLNVGMWGIVSGQGGFICNPTLPNAELFGVPGEEYLLEWKIFNYFDSSSDTITVVFEPELTFSDAGPDQLNIEDGSVTLSANSPTSGSGKWHLISGQGGVIHDDESPNSTFTGVNGVLYKLEWKITNNCFFASDTVCIHFFDCGYDLVDPRDLSTYPTVTIGSQCWMAKSLNFGQQFYPGTVPTNDSIIEKYCYGNCPLTCETYGGLYFWDEMVNYTLSTPGLQGICPPGWHIPALSEFETLVSHLGGSTIAGGKLKATGDDHWTSNVGATNDSGFTAFGGGFLTGTFSGFHTDVRFWSSTRSGSNAASLGLKNSNTSATLAYQQRTTGQSLRCLKD